MREIPDTKVVQPSQIDVKTEALPDAPDSVLRLLYYAGGTARRTPPEFTLEDRHLLLEIAWRFIEQADLS